MQYTIAIAKMPESFSTLPTELRQKIFLDTLSGFPRYHLPDRGLSEYIETTIGLKRSARAAKPSSAQKRHYTTEQPAKEPDMSALEHQIYCLAFIDDRAAEEMSIVLWLHLKRIYEPAREWYAQQREKMVFWVDYTAALHPADPRTRAINGVMQNQINRLAATADEMTSHKNCMERMLGQLQRSDIDDWPDLIAWREPWYMSMQTGKGFSQIWKE